MVTKIISFSLWGSDPKYCIGVIKNILLAYKFFPEWIVHVYYDDSVPNDTLDHIEYYNNTLLKERKKGFGAFWRFESMKPGTIVLSRDADSRLSLRERKIIDSWLESDKKMCVIRDHKNHYEFPILAGMFGIKDGLGEENLKLINNYNHISQYLIDQIYLKNHVWPSFKNDVDIYGIQETEWMKETYSEIGRHFIGQVYTDKDDTVYEPAI